MAKYSIGDIITYGLDKSKILCYFKIVDIKDNKYILISDISKYILLSDISNYRTMSIVCSFVDSVNTSFRKISNTDLLLYYKSERKFF